jgi:putative hydrolase
VFADAYEVAKCCADYGTLFEIDGRKEHLTDEEWAKVAETKVNFVIDSDAHTPENIGNVFKVFDLIKRVGIPEDRILNINGKMPPSLRFSEYKKKM